VRLFLGLLLGGGRWFDASQGASSASRISAVHFEVLNGAHLPVIYLIDQNETQPRVVQVIEDGLGKTTPRT
jgi:hypothetical protein